MAVQHARVNGVDLAYRVDGIEGKPWIVFCNGLATDHRLWDSQVEVLESDRHILRYDARGHGASAALPAPQTLDDLVADLLALMDHLGIGVAEICGVSLGGMTALGAAMRAPSRFLHIACCDARGDSPPNYANMWRERAARVARDGTQAIAAATLERWFTPHFAERPRSRLAIATAWSMILDTSVEGYCAGAAILTNVNLLSALPRLTMPVSFIIGSDDQAVPRDAMQAMAKATPNAQLHVIDNAGHLPNMEQPEQFNAVLKRELARDPVQPQL